MEKFQKALTRWRCFVQVSNNNFPLPSDENALLQKL